MKKDDPSTLKSLGSQGTSYKYNEPSVDILETFENQFLGREYEIFLEFKEFTSLCPKTGQPDFGTIEITYCPNEQCLETKSLKLYFFAFRQMGTFMETITNNILDDCVKKCSPRWMVVRGIFEARGGIKNTIVASYQEPK